MFKITFTHVFLIADKDKDMQGTGFEEDSIICPKELPVTMNGMNSLCGIVGTVKVKQTGNVYEGYFEIITKWSIEGMYPVVCGSVLERDGENIKKCQIDYISLFVNGNAEPRIKPITKEQLTCSIL